MQMHVATPNLKPEGNSMPDLPVLDLPLIEGTPESLAGYGEVVSGPGVRSQGSCDADIGFLRRWSNAWIIR